MNLEIHGKNIEVTKGIKGAVEESLNGIEKYFSDEDVNANVVVKVYPNGQKVEIQISNKSDSSMTSIRQEVFHDDLYAAIDIAGKNLHKQIKKLKKRTSKSKSGASIIDNLFKDNIESSNKQSNITKRKRIENKPMSEDEAILQFELIGHDFFIFEDIEDELIKVLYKRNDGNYGILEI